MCMHVERFGDLLFYLHTLGKVAGKYESRYVCESKKMRAIWCQSNYNVSSPPTELSTNAAIKCTVKPTHRIAVLQTNCEPHVIPD